MSLPSGFLDELRSRLSISQVVGRKVVWDQRKSNQAKGDMWAPCPFHQEKSASFHVDDQKGYYYCFGCHQKGDAISFVRETENVGFMEAIEILAREAGMSMPAPGPKAKQVSDKRSELFSVMEMAAQHFRLCLSTTAGAEAREYLARRGLSNEALARWEFGFAPDLWHGLIEALRSKGVSDQLLLEAGLAKKSQNGKQPYDTFRGRIMFPIRDAQGRCIAFGGRAMDPNDNAKYLNSPETVLFDKGRNLYNIAPARAACGKGKSLLVSEGYMDVIALSEAGFEACVAPLGTAITQEQLTLMWRISPEPIIALDGDQAGIRAAMRLIDLALPLLEAGKSLRFAVMPEGKDPDDVLKSDGPAAMQALIDQAQPMIDLLWQRETEGRVFDSPERKAALDKDLRAVISRIKDPSIRTHYGQAIKDKRWALFRAKPDNSWRNTPARGKKPGRFPAKQPASALPSTKGSMLANPSSQSAETLREAVILAVLLKRPDFVAKQLSRLERLDFLNPDYQEILAILLNHADSDSPDLAARIHDEIYHMMGPFPLENLFSLNHIKIAPAIRSSHDDEIVGACLNEELKKLETLRGVRREVADAEADMAAMPDEGVTWRLDQAAKARNQAMRSQSEDKTTYEVADNGSLVSRDERDALNALLAQIKRPEPKK